MHDVFYAQTKNPLENRVSQPRVNLPLG